MHLSKSALLSVSFAAALLAGCGGGDDHTPAPAVVADAAAPGFTVGSANVATAAPTLPRPSTTPCAVPLFTGYIFNDFSSQTFNYTPPASCPGPWSKVVLTADFSVTAGLQYDRTAHISVAGVNIYSGTTEEPGSSEAPSWHVERDLSEYASMFTTAQSGAVDLDNLVNSTYTGVLSGTAQLLFYPVDSNTPAAPSADAVYAFSSGANGRPVDLNTSTSTLSATYTFPTNVVRAYMDVIAQGQSNDEFWYTCAPNSLATQLQTCGSTAFRQTQITIDGTPAGLAPVYPWIFTGGIDPGLWRNIPAVQALNLQPYRVDLSPFAAKLDDGNPHTISLSVLNADSYFAVNAALLIYRDKVMQTVTGSITSNSLALPTAPNISNQTSVDSQSDTVGSLGTTSQTQYQIIGQIQSSHGLEVLSVQQNMNFSNVQTYTDTTQDFMQTTTVTSTSLSMIGNQQTMLTRQSSYPLHFNYSVDAAGNPTSVVNMAFNVQNTLNVNGQVTYSAQVNDNVNNSSLYVINTEPSMHTGAEQYQFGDSKGSCYNRTLTSNLLKLVSAIDAGSCGGIGSVARMPYNVDPYGGTGFVGPLGY